MLTKKTTRNLKTTEYQYENLRKTIKHSNCIVTKMNGNVCIPKYEEDRMYG